MKIPQDTGWQAATFIIEQLRAGGHVALLAGGCVRDMLLSLVPKDYDVATSATPEQVLERFPKSRMVGARFGVVLVRKFGRDVEVATFRTEGPYTDGRRPDHVTFGTPQQDANRRDFTINGVFFDPADEKMLDYVGGQEDLARRVLRTIGRPNDRFEEDHLRMLRAVRLSAKLVFEIESATADAIRRSAAQLRRISPERIWMELEQILTHPARARGWSLLHELGLTSHLSAEWPGEGGLTLTQPAAKNATGLDQARLAALPLVAISPQLALSAVLCDQDDQSVIRVCHSLRMSNRLTADTAWLVRSLPGTRRHESLELADLKLLMANRCWADLRVLLRADLAARRESVALADALDRRADQIPTTAISPPPLLSGDDLSKLGFSPGPRFGEVLSTIYRAQLNETIATREQAVALARQMMSRQV